MAYAQITFYGSDYDNMAYCLNNARSLFAHTIAAIDQFSGESDVFSYSKIATYERATSAASRVLDQDVMACVMEFREAKK